MAEIEVKKETWKNLGGSLPVENVQELASSANLQQVPVRYIRPEISPKDVSTGRSLQIPVIDMANLGSETEMAKLHGACEDWGFFQLINHGGNEAIEKMKAVTDEFFKLPLEQKMVYKQEAKHVEGYGQAFVVSEDQKLDWGDMLFLLPRPLSIRDLKFWPNIPECFRPTLDEYSSEMEKIFKNLVKSIAVNLGVDAEELVGMFEDGRQAVRMNYYPPCMEADKVYGLHPHSDASALTLVVQVNEVEGLQIRKNGKWLPIKPIPGAIIVNIGDVLEIMSNGKYKSIEHRAVVDVEKERLSIAAFHNPNLEAEVGPLADLMKENGAKYKTMGLEDFIRLAVNTKLNGKKLLEEVMIDE